MTEGTDVTMISILGAILVTLNQGLKFGIEALKAKYTNTDKKARAEVIKGYDPEIVPLLRAIDKRMQVVSHGVEVGTFACKWRDESQVGDHIRDAKETLIKINER